MSDKIFEYLEDIEGGPTAHLSGLKRVFLSNDETDTKLTQFAYGKFEPGDKTDMHRHSSMMECFYFIEGNGQYHVGDQVVDLRPGTFVKIPCNTDHQLMNNGDKPLVFVYFGVEQ